METPKPSAIRKYLYEYILIALCTAIIYLFYLYTSLNSFVRDELTNQMVQTRAALSENSQVLKEAIFLIKTKTVYNETRNQSSSLSFDRVRNFKSCNSFEKKSFNFEQGLYRVKSCFGLSQQGKTLHAKQAQFTNGIFCGNYRDFALRLQSSVGYLQSFPGYTDCLCDKRRIYSNCKHSFLRYGVSGK